MRLLWITEHYYPRRGGMAQSCDRIVYGLRAAGVHVDVLHLSARLARWHSTTQHNGVYLSCPVAADPAHTLQRAWLMVEQHARRHPPSHVVAFGGYLALLAAPVYAAWLDVPLITLLRGNDLDTGIFNAARRPILVDALQRSARTVVVCQEHARRLQRWLPSIQPVWIPNGIDVAAWEPLPSQRRWAATWRAEHATERRVFGLFGHLKRKKGTIFFLDALLHSGRAAAALVLIGGEVEADVRDWINAHAAQISVIHEPFMLHAELLARYLACDLIVLPSFYDGLPNVLLEAAALAQPVLCSTAGGLGDVLDQPGLGFTFTPGVAHECQQALQSALAASSHQLQQMGHALHEHVSGAFSHEREINAYLQLIGAI